MENQIQLTALPQAELLKLLRKSGGQLSAEDVIRQDIQRGAPVNPDGTINLVAYAAWLMLQRVEDGND